MGEDLLKDSEIRVETNKHVVTLTGTVVGRAVLIATITARISNEPC